MDKTGILVAAFAFGGAIGVLNNAISGWVSRFSARSGKGEPGGPGSIWPSLFALQFVLRIGLSLVSLYVAFRVSGGDAATILVNLAGLFVTRYVLLWRLARGGSGQNPGGLF